MRCIWLGLALVIASAPLARAQQPLGVGFYTPEVPVDPYQRFAYAQGLAQHIGKALGIPVTGHAYKGEGDLRRDIQAKKIGLAVLGGFYLASARVAAAKILATGTMSSKRQLTWSLCGKKAVPLSTLKGKTLQLPSLGPMVQGLVQHGLLDNNLELRTHFKIVESPDVTSAIEAVRLDQAQLVFAPVDAKGLRPLLAASIQVPPPAFVQLDPALDAEQVKQAVGALLGYKASAGALTGWTAGRPGDLARFAALGRKRARRMEMVALPLERLQYTDLVDPKAVTYELPGLDEHFQVP